MPRALERISNEDSRDHSRLRGLGIRRALHSREAPNYAPCTARVPTVTPSPRGSRDMSPCDVEMVFKVRDKREHQARSEVPLQIPQEGGEGTISR